MHQNLRIVRALGVCLFTCWAVTGSYAQEADSSRAAAYLLHGMEMMQRERFDSSAVCFEAARNLYQLLKKPERALYCGNRIVDIFVRQGRYREAEHELDRIENLELSEGMSESVEAVQTLYLRGLVELNVDSVQAAFSHLEFSLALARSLDGSDSLLVANCLYNLALAHQKVGSFDSAIIHINKVLEIYRRHEKAHSLDIAVALSVLGNILRAKGDVDQAVEILEESLSILARSRVDNGIQTCSLHILLGEAYSDRGELYRALAQFDSAATLAKCLFGEDHVLTASAYTSLGEAYSELGEWYRAAKLLNLAVERMSAHYGPRHSTLARTYDILARDYYFQDSLLQAEKTIDKAITLELGLLGRRQSSLARMYETQGLIRQKQGRHGEALCSFREAREILSSLGNQNGAQAVTVLIDEGASYASLGHVDIAQAVFQRALSSCTDGYKPYPRQVSSIWRELGRVYEGRGDVSGASSAYDHAMSATQAYSNGQICEAGEVIYPQPFLAAALSKLQLAEKQLAQGCPGPHELAAPLRLCRQALHVLEMFRRSMREERSQISLGQQTTPFCETGIRLSLKLWQLTHNAAYKDTAFAFAEYGKSRALVGALQWQAALRIAGVPDSLSRKASDLSAAITSINILLGRAAEGTPRPLLHTTVKLQARQLVLMQELSHLEDSLKEAFPQIGELMGSSNEMDVRAFRNAMVEDACLVEYFQGRNDIYAFLVNRREVTVVDLGTAKGFDVLVNDYLSSIRTVEAQAYIAAASALYRKLFAPLRNRLARINHLVIAPDWSFAAVPFEALLERKNPSWKDSRTIDFSQLPYLVRRYSISYTYCATFYLRMQKRHSASWEPVNEFSGFAPVAAEEQLLALNPTVMGLDFAESMIDDDLSRVRDGFTALPYSRDEVESIASLFTRKGKRSEVRVGKDATESNFKQAGRRSRFLHLATHGFVHREEPARSSLVFSEAIRQRVGEGRNDDGFLYAEEAYTLGLNAQLVVLSSCESGVGRAYKGEGLVALARGFFHAGAEQVACSLWKVLDQSTAQLMVHFYGHALEGASFADAMRNAKLQLIRSPSTAFPRDWASFVLIGM